MRLAKILAGALIALSALPAPAQSSLPDAPPAKPVVYKVGNGVTPPKVVYAVDPEYTEGARKHRLQGVSGLSLIVDAQGRPQEVKLARSLASGVDPKYYADARGLDDKAVEAVRQYRFKPGTLKGDPVAVSIQMEVSFQLF